MIDPLLSQALVFTDRHYRKRRFIYGRGKRASLVCVTPYGYKADASKVVGYSDKKTGCYLSGLGYIGKTSIWCPAEHEADEVVYIGIRLKVVF